MGEKDLGHHIHSLLKYDLEYVGVINAQGRLVEHASKNLRISPEKLEMLCMGIRLQHSMQSDFDEELGTVNYIVTERSTLKFISLPISGNALLVITKKGADHGPLIKKICSKQFSDTLKSHLECHNVVQVGVRK
ncbi:MAG: hypothetical protein KGI27_02660 [Thaumarchaeota archaeon]|nr:hypothetical protein [Nitrososphaerota archaeon]